MSLFSERGFDCCIFSKESELRTRGISWCVDSNPNTIHLKKGEGVKKKDFSCKLYLHF